MLPWQEKAAWFVDLYLSIIKKNSIWFRFNFIALNEKIFIYQVIIVVVYYLSFAFFWEKMTDLKEAKDQTEFFNRLNIIKKRDIKDLIFALTLPFLVHFL